MRPESPDPISVRERLLLLVPVGLVILAVYSVLNQAPVFTPRLLPLTAVDRAVPFWVWTIWPYIALNLSNAVIPFFIRGRRTFRQSVLTLCLVMGVSALFWLLWPTTYPRPAAPVDASASAWLYNTLMRMDAPTSCFPSAHIAGPAAQLIFLSREQPKLKGLLWGGYALIAPTVLTTKQHYLWDILGSLVLVAGAYWVGGWLLDRRALKEP